MDKPGYKTTEFWLSLAAMLIGVLIASGAIAEASAIGKVLAFAASTLAVMGYSVSRGVVKKGDQVAKVLASRSKADPT